MPQPSPIPVPDETSTARDSERLSADIIYYPFGTGPSYSTSDEDSFRVTGRRVDTLEVYRFDKGSKTMSSVEGGFMNEPRIVEDALYESALFKLWIITVTLAIFALSTWGALLGYAV